MGAEKVFVTGIGVVAPAGTGLASYADGIFAGQSLVRTLPPSLTAGIGAVGAHVGVEHDASMSRYEALGTLATTEAMAASGLSRRQLTNASVVTATAIGATAELEWAYRGGRKPAVAELQFDGLEAAVRGATGAAGRGYVMSTGCTAGLDAVGAAFRAIRSGREQLSVVCAADAALSPIVIAAFKKIGALTGHLANPASASRPFDRARDGFALGEGAAALVLESAASVRARGGEPRFEITGWASVSSALHMTALRRDGSDIARALSAALADARTEPAAIDAIDCHGTSTPLNDESEAAALWTVFGEGIARVSISAQKGVNGHALGASNLIEVAGCGVMFARQAVPPIANTTDPEGALPLVLGAAKSRPVGRIVKLSSGFSGIHTAMVLAAA